MANAANSTSASLARLVGSPLGGIVVALGGLGPVVLVDGLSFLAVGLATWFVRADTAPVGDHEHRPACAPGCTSSAANAGCAASSRR